METIRSSEKIIRQLYQITNNYDLGFETQIKQIIKMGLERFNLDIGILAKIEQNRYFVKHCVVPKDVELTPGMEFDLSNTYCHITCTKNAPIALEHIGNDDLYGTHPAYKAFGLESYIGMPIHLNGVLYGTLNFSSAKPYKRKFQSVDIEAIQLVTSWVEVELIRRQQEKRLKELNHILERKAYEDSLTSIPNRRAMFKHVVVDLNRITREKGKVTLAILDIDLFKNINDTYGHQKGDEVLIKVASTINHNKRDYDFLSRFGGEEFLLWLPNSDTQTASIVCTRIKDKIEQLSLCELPVTISIGVSCYQYGDLPDFENKIGKVDQLILDQLISEADIALYKAKDSGRNCIKFHQR
jgi:diguanylate cyclase (GGDEF)-like protein